MKTNFNRVSVILILCALTLLQFGCRSARRGEPIQGAMNISNPNIAHGEKLFMQHCYACHPNGEGGLGPSFNNKPAPRFLVKTQIRAGLGIMPEFPENKISSDELNDLADYVIVLRRHGGRSAQR